MAAEVLTYLRIIKKRWWLIVLLFVVTTAVILLSSLREKPVYQAYVRLQVIAPESQEVSLFSTAKASSIAEEIVAVQVQFDAALHSYYVAWQTINDLNLGVSAAKLLEGLSVSAEEEFLHVTFTADNPLDVEAIATRHVENAFKYYAQIRAKSASVALSFIQQQLSDEEKTLASAQSELLTFKINHNLDSLSREILALQDQLRDLRLVRARLTADREREQAIASKYREQAAKADPKKPTLDYETLALEKDAVVAGILAQEAQYDHMIDEQRARLEELLKLSTEYDTLVRNVTRSQSNYGFLADKENEARLKEKQATNVSFIQIVEPARMPDRPAASRTPKMLAIGVVLSLIAGVILTFVFEFVSLLFVSARSASSSLPGKEGHA
ncbi:MAG: Chain length determinant protein [Chloroflexi bacterium ADurb.Bin180]|nr:MAG: Chain length determinant protein [Chloroflexi bacterium ADurb.Bin180]